MKYLLRKLKRRSKSLIQTATKVLTQTKEERRHALVGPPSLWKMKRQFQIQFLTEMGLKPQHELFEIGCGTLRGGLPLIQYLENGHYFGMDVREEVLNEGRKELKETGLEGKNSTLLLCPDISELTINQKFDYIWSYSVLFHMNDEILNDALAFVSRHLSDEGVFYANVNMGEGKEGNWQGFPYVARTFEFYNQACAVNGLVASDIGPLKELGHIANIESHDNQRMLKIAKKASQ